MPMLQSNPFLLTLLESCAIELSYTSWDLYPFFRDKLGRNIPPFRWESARRRKLEVLINAVVAHLYGVDSFDLDYIMDTFGGIKRDEEAHFGSFRLKEEILEALTLVRSIAESTFLNDPEKTLGDIHSPRIIPEEIPALIKHLLIPPPADSSQGHPLPSRLEAESKMPWIDWSTLPAQF